MSRLKEFIAELEFSQISDFERDILIPQTLSRIRYYIETFTKLIPICEDQDNASIIDTAVRKVVSDPTLDPSLPTPKVGAAYLQGIKNQITEYWIKDLSAFIRDYPDATAVDDPKKLFLFIQRAQNLCSSIIWCKERLLSYSFRAFPIIRNKVTGEQEYGIPKELEIIAYPFLTIIPELVSSAESLVESFKMWRQSKKDLKTEYSSFLMAQKQLESAEALNRFQVLVIIFTVILTLCSEEILFFVRKLILIVLTLLRSY